MIQSKIENVQPEEKLNSEQTAQDKHVSPSIANALVGGSFVVTPELPIGTEFWFLWNGKMEFGLVAAYRVYVTSCTEDDSWHRQLFRRWLNRKAKDVWKYDFTYEVKLDMSITSGNYLEKKGGKWFFLDRQIFFSVDELKRSL